MDIENLRQNWALFVAATLVVLVGIVVVCAMVRRSSGGQLRRAARVLRQAERESENSKKAVAAAQRAVAKLEARAASTKPRTLEAARGALGDARALEKIAGDRLLVAANLLRKVIYLEYPPQRHAALRQKYLPGDGPDDRPFSF